MTDTTMTHIKLMRECGTWAAARHLFKSGYPIGYALYVLRASKV